MAEREGYVRCQRCETWHRSSAELEEREGVRVCRDRRECTRTLHRVRDMTFTTARGGHHELEKRSEGR